MLKLGAFALIISVAGISHTFLAPSIVAAIALTQVAVEEHIYAILGAWLLGITLAAFMRGR